MPREFHYVWTVHLQSTPEALWPLVSDTNRFDRDTGLPPVKTKKAPPGQDRLPRKRGELILAGMRLEWDEEPFEWVRPHRFGVVRNYYAGPIKQLIVKVELEPKPEGGTVLNYRVWVKAATFVGSLLIPVQTGIVARNKFIETFQRYDARIQAGEAHLPSTTKVKLAPEAESRIEAARASLLENEVSEDLADKLIAALTTEDDIDLSRMRPYAYADRWGASRRAVLVLFLQATRASLLDLRWDVVCPLCRGVDEGSRSLSEIERNSHCDTCHIDYGANFDQSVELTFRPNAGVRELHATNFCIGNPQLTPHIVAQQLVATGQTRTVKMALEPGRHRVRGLGMPGGQYFDVATTGSPTAHFTAADAGWSAEEPQLGVMAELTLENSTGIDQLFIVEHMAWSDEAVTAAEVTALQIFRDLFATEALRPGEEISVQSVSLLFTDLCESTRLYLEIGDAPAFGRVMSHFDLLRDCVAEHDGALVKTIGDAVMAAFRRPADALAAALDMHQRLAQLSADEPLRLKAGIHTGPCIAVTLNDRLDYFGSTVNLAARIEKLSRGGDIVVTSATFGDAQVGELLRTRGENIAVDSFTATIRGFGENEFALNRVVVQRE